MKGFIQDIEKLAITNQDFRQVLYTPKNCQLLVRSIKPKEEIGMEIHKLDQFFRVEKGTGEAILDGVHTKIGDGVAPAHVLKLRPTPKILTVKPPNLSRRPWKVSCTPCITILTHPTNR